MNLKLAAEKEIFDYVVVLKNDHFSAVKKTGWLLSTLTLTLLIVSIYLDRNALILSIALAVCTILLISNWIEESNKKQINFKYILITGGIGLIIASPLPFIIGILLLLCGLTEKTIMQKREFGFSKNKIQENGIFGRKINWSDLNRVVIKDDLLTIDFKNNKLLQCYVDDEDDEEYEVEEDEFNTYCENQIAQA
jgi:hypothetical protein